MSRKKSEPGSESTGVKVVDLGRMGYQRAYEEQTRLVAATLAQRDAGTPLPGTILLVEHEPPVITITRRPGAAKSLLADEASLAREGVEVVQTDRGGDITYHGPGQLVVYPILDLNWYGLRLHAYMRLLEQAAIDTCARFGVAACRDSGATGVWVRAGEGEHEQGAKICALGVRIRRWVSMHGMALNVTTNMAHFDFIVPCGLVGRRVTSLQQELAGACPDMSQVKTATVEQLQRLLSEARQRVVDSAGSDPVARV